MSGVELVAWGGAGGYVLAHVECAVADILRARRRARAAVQAARARAADQEARSRAAVADARRRARTWR